MGVVKDLVILCIFVFSLLVLFQTTDQLIALLSVIVTVSIYVIKHVKLNIFLKKELKSKVHFFEALLNSSPDIVVYQNKNLKVIACNEILCKTHHKTKEEILGNDLEFLFKNTPENAKVCALMIEKLQEVLRTKQSVKFFATVFEGKANYYNILISPTLDDKENVNGTLLVARNVTTEYLASKKVQEKEKQLKCILENVPIGAFMKDKNDKFIVGSTSFEKILQLQKDEKMRQLVLSDIFQQE